MSGARDRTEMFLRGSESGLARIARRVRRWRQGDRTRHREVLFELLPPRSVGAEIGVHRGDLSARLLRRLDLQRLHLIDPWRYVRSPDHPGLLQGGRVGRDQRNMDRRYRGILARFKREIEAGVVVVHRGTAAEAAPDIPDASLDWAYIDGDHSYEAVANDISTYAPKLAPGGLMAGDDYGERVGPRAGVSQAVDELIESARPTVLRLDPGDRQWVLRLPEEPPAGTARLTASS